MRSSPLILSSTARRSADLQLAWVDAADDVHDAYVAWRQADRAERSASFLVYQAALDREEAAARALELHVSGRAPRL
jgi:hypothetical protein